VQVRRVEPADIRGFTGSNWRVFNEGIGWDFAEEKECFAVFKDNRVVGAARCCMRGGLMVLKSIIVNRDFRGQGIGTALLEQVEDSARRKSCPKVVLETSARHKDAIEFYLRRGYQIVATRYEWFFEADWYSLEKPP